MKPKHLLCLAILTWAFTSFAAADDRPNIVLIMADDMGYSDIGCYGGEVQTPTLNRLANEGLRFTQFYNTGRCCPTRASLLTALYPHQAGVGWMMSDDGHEGYRGDLNRRCQTIAEVLKRSGYKTYMAGKWHVTKDIRPDGDKSNWPRQRGFDRFYGTIHGAGSFYDPNSLTRDNTQIVPDESPYYYTDAISNNAIRFINEHREGPFFLYMAYTAPHWPMHALEEDIAKYQGRYSEGWDQLRQERYERMVEMGLIRPEWKMTQRDEGIDSWEAIAEKAWYERRMEVYAAMIDRMDQGIGRVVATLEKQNLLDNTLILFLADNGGCAEEYGSRGAVKPDPNTVTEIVAMGTDELQTAMQPPKTRDGRPVRTGFGVMPGPADTYVAYGKPWANASNTPFRRYKHWVHEGGISTPLIAHWPKQIHRHGELEHQPGHLIDIMATCIDVAKADYPTEVEGIAIQPPEGRSLAPAFRGATIEREALFWEHEGNRAIRQGDWKLVAAGKEGPWELYDLNADRTELQNLSEVHPERVKAMKAAWEAYAERANVYPLTPYWNQQNNNELNRRQKRFELKNGDNLGKAKAPVVHERDLHGVGRLAYQGKDGVIVAQGGTAHGFALYVHDGKLEFATRHSGELKTWAADSSLKKGEHTLKLVYPAKGLLTVSIDGVEVIRAQTPGRLQSMPADGLQVGKDANGLVGRYTTEGDWAGDIELVIELQ
jgi:arylsulfatase A-like enzyme